jgi:hypothetical protein
MNLAFQIIETFAPLIPVITFFIAKPPKQKWITVLILYAVIYVPLVAYANYLQIKVIPNIIIYVFITIITFCGFSFIIDFVLSNRIFSFINYGVIAVVTAFSIANAWWWEKLDYYNSNSASLANIILIAYCLYYYWQQIKQPKDMFINRQPSFWIITGILIYCGGNFFLFTNYNKLCLQALEYNNSGLTEQAHRLWNFAELIWIIADFFILVTNIFFAKAILCIRRK